MRIIEHTLGNTLLRYFINADGEISMYMVPISQKNAIKNGWEYPNDPWTTTAPYMRQWRIERLVHFHLAHHGIPVTGGDSLKFVGESAVYFKDQKVVNVTRAALLYLYIDGFDLLIFYRGFFFSSMLIRSMV